MEEDVTVTEDMDSECHIAKYWSIQALGRYKLSPVFQLHILRIIDCGICRSLLGFNHFVPQLCI